jgi:hypothetical protein
MRENTDFWPQIKVACLRNGELLVPKETYFHSDCTISYLGRKLGKSVELRASARPSGRGATIVAFEGRGQGPLTKKRNLAETPGQCIFSKIIPVRYDPDKINPPFTRFPENHFRILEIKGNTLRHFEVAVVAHRGYFFVIKQLTRQGELFRDDGEVLFPPFVGWPEFTDLLSKIAKGRALKKTSAFKEPDPPEANGLGNFQGRSLWWNLAQGFGAILLRNGHGARLHRNNLRRENSHLPYLGPGELVEFEKLSLPNQTTERSTAFRQEVYAARVVVE